MKRIKKSLYILLSLVLCVTVAFGTAPVTSAAGGMLRLIIDGELYTSLKTPLLFTRWSYTASDDVLTLKGYGTSSSPETPIFVYPYSGKLTIKLEGNNYIRTSGEPGIIAIGDVTFTGNGTLTLICPDTYCYSSDYSLSVTEGASLVCSGNGGIMAESGIKIDTTGSVTVTSRGKCTYTGGEIRVTSGQVSMSGSNGFFSYGGNVIMRGGDTDVEITSTDKAIYLTGQNAYAEWSANAVVTAGVSAPGASVSSYNNEKYFHAAFSGLPKLNPPRKVDWDETAINGEPNPVGRWSAVENASGYFVRLYYKNSYGTFSLIDTFTVTDALSCNFGGHFTSYGEYYFTVQALGDVTNYVSSDDSPISASSYYYSGDVASRYYISLPEADYYTVTPVSGTTVCYYGHSYSFTVEVDPAYDQSSVKVWANGVRVALRHGLYTIDNVTENITVTIGEMDINTYRVILPESEAYTLYPLPGYDAERIEYGGAFSFSIELSPIYMQSYPIVKANGAELYARYGIIYTINNICEDQIISIEGLIRDYYDVIFKELDGTVISTQSVDHGYCASVPGTPASPSNLTFVGWYLKDGTAFDFSTPITENTVLFARYAAQTDSDGYYLIPDYTTLCWFRDEVDYGNTAINGRLTADISINSGKYVKVGNEAVFGSDAEQWTPIGGYDYTDPNDYVRFFEGSFDGNGHTLRGFFIDIDPMEAGASDLGIFGIITADSSICDLNVSDSYFSGYENIGGIAGTSSGVISGCTSSASCNGVSTVGGIVGYSGASISGCTFTGFVDVEHYTQDSSVAYIGGEFAGGIIGAAFNAVTVENCVSRGTVHAYDCAGGFVGAAEQTVTFIYSYNESSVSSETFAAGFMPFGSLEASFCYNVGSVEADLAAAGFCADADSALVNECHNYANITGAQTEPFVIGSSGITVTSSYYLDESFPDAQYGIAAEYEWFHCGYVSSLMNLALDEGFWAKGDNDYPVFADGSHPVFYAALDGRGTRQSPYLLKSENDLRVMACLVNNEEGYSSAYYKITDDITVLNGEMPVIASQSSPFTGSLNGDGHFIEGITIGKPQENYVGLFSAARNATVTDLTLKNVSITGNNYVGAIAGLFEGGSMLNVTVNGGDVTGNVYVGSVAGKCSASCSQMKNYASVSGTEIVGGIMGFLEDSNLDYAENYGAVSGSTETGGIVGFTNGFVYIALSSAAVTGDSSVGGVAGVNYGTLYSCYNNAPVTADRDFGGICGTSDIDAVIEACYYNTANISSAGNNYGVRQTTSMIRSGMTAYNLNDGGGNIGWAQSDTESPVPAMEDGSDAVTVCVRFYSDDSLFYSGATYAGGSVYAPTVPQKSGYNFIRWDTATDEVYDTMDVHAVFDRDFAITLTPTATISIAESENGIHIVGVTPGMTYGDLLDMIANENADVTDEFDVPADLDLPVATGAKVQLYDEYGVSLQSASIILFGDVNSDGAVDSFDALLISCIVSGALDEDAFSTEQMLAADIDNDSEITADDFDVIQDYLLLKTDIVQSREQI